MSLSEWWAELDFSTLLCRIFGHSMPFQAAGERVFRCKRCKLAFGIDYPPLPRSLPPAPTPPRRPGGVRV